MNNDLGEAEYPFDKSTVFSALLKAIPQVKGVSVHSSDQLSGRVVVKAGTSLFSWGENIPISLIESSPNRTVVRVTSTPKTGISSVGFLDNDGVFVGGNMDFGKNRRNVEAIFSALSYELAKVNPPRPTEGARKPCPFCAELIQKAAIKCRFCGSDIQEPAKPSADSQTDANQFLSCRCQSCDLTIEFPPHEIGKTVTCIKCGLDTTLYSNAQP